MAASASIASRPGGPRRALLLACSPTGWRQARASRGLAVQALAIITYLSVSQLDRFYALALVFGAAYGGVMRSPCWRAVFRPAHHGRGVRRGDSLEPRHGARARGGRWVFDAPAVTPGSISARSAYARRGSPALAFPAAAFAARGAAASGVVTSLRLASANAEKRQPEVVP